MAEEALIMLVAGEILIGNIGKIRKTREILKVVEGVEDAEWVPEAGEVTSEWLLEESGVEAVVEVLAEAATDQIKKEEAKDLVRLIPGIPLGLSNKSNRGGGTTRTRLTMQVTGEMTSPQPRTGTMMSTPGLWRTPRCSHPVGHLLRLGASRSTGQLLVMWVSLGQVKPRLRVKPTTASPTVSPSICRLCSKQAASASTTLPPVRISSPPSVSGAGRPRARLRGKASQGQDTRGAA